MNQICNKCNKNKNESEFHWRVKDIKRKASCISCCRSYLKEHYKNNKEKIINRVVKNREKIKKWFIEYKKTLKCERCNFDQPAALQFHHTNNDKFMNVSDMSHRGYSIKKIETEIEKCIILCANCHMIEHSKISLISANS